MLQKGLTGTAANTSPGPVSGILVSGMLLMDMRRFTLYATLQAITWGMSARSCLHTGSIEKVPGVHTQSVQQSAEHVGRAETTVSSSWSC